MSVLEEPSERGRSAEGKHASSLRHQRRLVNLDSFVNFRKQSSISNVLSKLPLRGPISQRDAHHTGSPLPSLYLSLDTANVFLRRTDNAKRARTCTWFGARSFAQRSIGR